MAAPRSTPVLAQANPESQTPFSTDQLRPNSRSYLDMIPRLLSLYSEHIYPIMPLIYIPTVKSLISRPMSPAEKRHVYSLCALTAFHMSGKSIKASPAAGLDAHHPPWETIGRFFLDESIAARQAYDFEDDVSLQAITASFWMSTSFFEIGQTQKSWYYLKEALTLAVDLGLDNNAKYAGLGEPEVTCRLRVFWILFVTERSFAIFRRKPLTLARTPSLPSASHSYESPEIQAGFLKLIFQYYPLDSSFVNAWNEDERDASNTRETFLNLHSRLQQATVSPVSSPTSACKSEEPSEPEPTTIQKADILMTQQWLRLIVWQASLRQGLLSTHAQDPCMSFSFPLSVARQTASVLMSLPDRAVEVHGMGIFEKIFEIASTYVGVLGTCEKSWDSMEVMGLPRMQYLNNPLQFFIRRLSASENSKRIFADRLLEIAGEQPSAMKMLMSPPLPLEKPQRSGLPSHQQLSPQPDPVDRIKIKEESDSETTSLHASLSQLYPASTRPSLPAAPPTSATAFPVPPGPPIHPRDPGNETQNKRKMGGEPANSPNSHFRGHTTSTQSTRLTVPQRPATALPFLRRRQSQGEPAAEDGQVEKTERTSPAPDGNAFDFSF